ncbi:DNA gyrase inhibitor YacG [Bradyrhizobium sp.]|uniref:DNA gyrase inhibitor YacG n=1 Tax=Bradyrhizobium sp. TaxID=376 RepID=UPI002D3478CC|nr:DNA gyrase inhibitor YacG [Bradyrhizobium sp.]HZR71536.1 DNA gyrase inhibitor YacG [Bradyrhizobium sp.]
MPAKPPGNGASEAKAAKPCPICGKPSTQENHPFCSPRCRDVDLNRWLSGSYMIPGRDNDEDQGD